MVDNINELGANRTVDVVGDADMPVTSIPWLRCFGRVQLALLVVWLSVISFFPPSLSSLSMLVLLLPVWGLAILLGLWHVVKVPEQRTYAVFVIAAYPAAALLALAVQEHLPLVTGATGVLCFFAVLAAWPALLLGQWLGRVSTPSSHTEQASGLPTKVLFGVEAVLLCVTALLAWLLFSGESMPSLKTIFVRGWYENTFRVATWSTAALTVVAVPYALLGMFRRSRHLGAMLLMLVGVVLIGLCLGSIYFALLLGTAG